jgi:hypothetical protein
MTRRRFGSRSGLQHISKPLERPLRSIQDAQTIRALLARGCVATPIGATTTIRLDIGSAQSFPTALVDQVRREMERDAGEAE